MSKGWVGGSTRRWREVTRPYVLNRDKWICQLCHRPIPRGLPRDHPDAAQVHHTRGKAYGDDPRYLVAAHRQCNLDAGDPTKTPDPAPEPMTRW